jgi:hypothetical protein
MPIIIYRILIVILIIFLPEMGLAIPLLGVVGGSNTATVGTNPPTYASWIYHKGININTTTTGAGLSGNVGGGTVTTGFPMCIQIKGGLSDTNYWTSAELTHFFNDTYNPSGKRIRFYASDKTTILNYEVEYFYNDNATNRPASIAVYWVSIPTIVGNNANTNVIYIAFDNTQDPTGIDQDNKTGVWDSSYQMVQHLGTNSWGSSPEAKDSTSNVLNGSNAGSTDVVAMVQQGRNFTSDDAISWTSYVIPTTGTLSFWWKPNTTLTGTQRELFDSRIASPLKIFALIYYSDNHMYGGWYNNTNDDRVNWTASGLSSGSSYYLTLTWTNGGTTELSVNTVSKGTTTSLDATFDTTSGGTYIGRDSGGTYTPNDNIDEFRMSNIARSSDWLKMEYYSMLKTNYNGDNGASAATITWNAEE